MRSYFTSFIRYCKVVFLTKTVILMLRKITFKYMNLFQLRIFTFLNNVLRNKEEVYEPKYIYKKNFHQKFTKAIYFQKLQILELH